MISYELFNIIAKDNHLEIIGQMQLLKRFIKGYSLGICLDARNKAQYKES